MRQGTPKQSKGGGDASREMVAGGHSKQPAESAQENAREEKGTPRARAGSPGGVADTGLGPLGQARACAGLVFDKFSTVVDSSYLVQEDLDKTTVVGLTSTRQRQSNIFLFLCRQLLGFGAWVAAKAPGSSNGHTVSVHSHLPHLPVRGGGLQEKRTLPAWLISFCLL